MEATLTDLSVPRTIAPARTCVFTIASRNYLHYALNLMASVAEHVPQARRVIVLCDAAEGTTLPDAGIELLPIEALGVTHLDRMIVQYTILELNTAVKPFAFARLFDGDRADAVIYFDPDIELHGSGAGLLDRLATADIVLTPHLTAPLTDGRHPSDLSILQSGTYNLGFLALARSADAQTLLHWWQGKLLRDCVVDIARGLFTDQKWIDLVPGLFARAHVERDPGWNVAYWNLAHRDVHLDDRGRYFVNRRPLFFFHYSGYDPATASISKHQDRFRLVDCSPATRALFAQYVQRLDRHGRERFAPLPYAYERLADGTVLPECARQVIREQLDWEAATPDLRSEQGARFLIDFLTAPVDGRSPPISRIAAQLHRARADLQAAFPDLLGTHRQPYLAWFSERAGIEAGIVGPLAGRAVDSPRAQPAPEPTTTVSPSKAVAAPRGKAHWHYRMAYRLAWSARHVLRPLTPPRLRQRLRAALIQRAFPPTPVAPAPAPGDLAPALPFGVTVVGYVKAESGVGESARATLRALATTDVPHALADFRHGNVSRMGEDIDERLANGVRHAITLFHINADQMPLARSFLDEAYFSSSYRIGFWAWELETFPSEWQGAFQHVDEVWVPSSFCQRAVAAASPVPVLVMPHAIAIPDTLAPDRGRFGLRPDSVVFLAMADMMSVAERKNPFGAIEAFAQAFGDGGHDVELVVKVSNVARDGAAHARLQALARRCRGVHLLAESLDRPALNALIDSVDCFVSLHRSEGFGLVIAEAMARAKVVVATAWSGNMDFMTAQNSLPVDYSLRTLEADAGPYKRGERWAEPSIQDAAGRLRQVATDAALRQRLGQRARTDCRLNLAPAVVGARMAARLRRVSAGATP